MPDTGFQADIVEQVAFHVIDCGIVPKDPAREDMEFIPNVQIIGFGHRCVYQVEGQKLLKQWGMPETAKLVEFPSTELIRHMVMCGLGVAFFPEITVQHELAGESLQTTHIVKRRFTIHHDNFRIIPLSNVYFTFGQRQQSLDGRRHDKSGHHVRSKHLLARVG